jgi:hypothetical protein
MCHEVKLNVVRPISLIAAGFVPVASPDVEHAAKVSAPVAVQSGPHSAGKRLGRGICRAVAVSLHTATDSPSGPVSVGLPLSDMTHSAILGEAVPCGLPPQSMRVPHKFVTADVFSSKVRNASSITQPPFLA